MRKPVLNAISLKNFLLRFRVVGTQKLQVLALGSILMLGYDEAECRVVRPAHALKSNN